VSTATGVGRRSPLPTGPYAAPPEQRGPQSALEVVFVGEDGRSKVFSLAGLPMPGWHQAVAGAFATRTGPGGALRTRASAQSSWSVVLRLLRFLPRCDPSPPIPGALTVAHLEAFRHHRSATLGDLKGLHELRSAVLVLREPALRELLAPPVVEYLGRRWREPRQVGVAGYSDGEFTRIVSAARSSAAAIAARLAVSDRLLAAREHERSQLSPAEQSEADVLADIAEYGVVPTVPGADGRSVRKQSAAQLFLTIDDLAPLVVLLVALTGRNGETVKELPAEHQLLDGRAVQVQVVKRRRGPTQWFDQTAWEIGPDSRRLHTPGGFYLLVRQLTERGRTFSGSSSIWSIWRDGRSHGLDSDHIDPFADVLSTMIHLNRWARQVDLRDDDGAPLTINLGRLRTSVEVRRVKAMGGHLPSAARTNTMQVMWNSYLRGDPVVIDWAQDVMDTALADAEAEALAAHERTVAAHGGRPRVVADTSAAGTVAHAAGLDAATAEQVAAGALDTGWTACADRQHSPFNAGTCQSSFLDCFHCGNAVITGDHLPRLLALLQALEARREQLGAEAWWRRYGPVWAAIRHRVLPEFSPAQVTAAKAAAAPDPVLDLVEGLREPT